MKNIKQLLIDLGACDEAVAWAETLDFDFDKAYEKCERGDWLLWLHFRTNESDLRQRTLVKGLVAKTVEHLMKDERSKAAVKAAIDYGKGLINDKKLAAYAAAYAAADAAYAAAYAAADAAYAKKESLKKSADIFRSVIKIEDFKI